MEGQLGEIIAPGPEGAPEIASGDRPRKKVEDFIKAGRLGRPKAEEEATPPPMSWNDLMAKLHGGLRPVLREMLAQVKGYTDEAIQQIAEDHFATYRETALALKRAGLTNEEVVDCVAENLARQEVIQPRETEVAQVFQFLAETDLQVKAFLQRDPFAQGDYERLLRGDFMEEYRYGPLQERMKLRLRPHVERELASVLPPTVSVAAHLKNLFEQLLSVGLLGQGLP